MTEAIDTADLRRRVYDAARTPAIRLTPTTLKLAQAGGVFHLNGTEADEIARAVMDLIEPVLADYQRLKLAEDTDRAAARRVRTEWDAGRPPTGPCEDCSCCTVTGCHQGPDSTCPTDRLGHSVCPCTGD